MDVLDLFSGIGGFSLGLERAGMRTVAFCEIEAYPRAVLAKRWPGVPIHEDIRELDGKAYRSVDVVVGGFPCQPFSQAGKRLGKKDDRHLWPEMFRVIRESRPTWVIGENVIGLRKMGLDECLSDLEGEGYACQTFNIPACAVGAPHRRQRLWIVAHAGGEPLRHEPGRDGGANRKGPPELEHDGARRADTDTHNGRRRGFGLKEHGAKQRARGAEPDRLVTPGRRTGAVDAHAGREPAEISIEWPTEPPVCGADDGVPNRVDRLRALGNAVVPQIPEMIGRAIMKIETRT